MYNIVKVTDVGAKSWFVLLNAEQMGIVEEATKYLKHKTRENCSPNTVRKIAYSLSYYYEYLDQIKVELGQVLLMKYAEQHEHFIGFLLWLKEGNHTNKGKAPNNTTCNSYLQAVFGFYEFLILQYSPKGDIRVLECRDITYSGMAGVKFSHSIKTFRGYLPSQHSEGRTIEESKIKRILEATDSIRNKLLILLLAETGFRIGEILGIHYGTDIDFEKHTIKVEFRDDNVNFARAKNAEYRRAKISDDTFEILTLYIAENRKVLQKSEYLFVNLHGKTEGEPMNVNGVYSVLRCLEKKTGIKVTPHMLRRYFANERRKNGWSMDKISKALGHRQLATTERYMHVEDWEMEDVMDQYYEEHAGLVGIKQII